MYVFLYLVCRYYACVSVCMHVSRMVWVGCLYVCMCEEWCELEVIPHVLCMHMYMHIYTYSYICIYAYMYTQTYACAYG
jgi:hypothetical protein